MWHEKPYINSGAIIRREVLPNKKSKIMGGGIPPASVAEFYWNFGILGITLGMFLIGRFMKLMYSSFRIWLPKSRNAMLIYIGFIVQMSFVLVGDSFNRALIQALQNIIPAILIILFLHRKKIVLRKVN